MRLDYRLKRIEQTEAQSRPLAERRVIRIIAGYSDKQAAYALARSHGFDPDDETSNDLIILRTIVTIPGRPPYSKPPYAMYAG